MKNYLSEVRKELPANCLFDKVRVGCGGTTLAIECDKPYIICVPFTSLVENKVAQYPNKRYKGKLFGVLAGITVTDIKKYVSSTTTPKIITTYDGLKKVIEAINPKDYYLLVDEYHILFTQYSFRSEAIKYVLNHFRDFKEFCFMTATPIEQEFILEELKDLPLVKQDWGTKEINVEVLTIECESVKAATLKLVMDFLCGKYEGNAYLFLNSTKVIKQIIDKLDLTSDNTRVIYSKHSRVQMCIPNGKTLDAPKKINFLTSTAFEGNDIYDEDGRIFIISDQNAPHSLLDISTSIQQIAGRIRNSKYLGEIVHLYNTNRYLKLNYEEFKKSQEEESIKCRIAANEFNSLSEDFREKFVPDASALYLIKNADNLVEFDNNLVKVDTFNYKVATSYTIRVNIDELYRSKNFTVMSGADYTSMKDLSIAKETITFKEVIKEIEEAYLKDVVINRYIDKYPFLEDAIKKLGIDNIKQLKYNQKAIKNALLNLQDCPIEHKVIKALKYKTGEFITSKELKKKLNEVYESLNINSKAKATDISKYFDVKEGKRTINDKRVNGYYILRPVYRISDR